MTRILLTNNIGVASVRIEWLVAKEKRETQRKAVRKVRPVPGQTQDPAQALLRPNQEGKEVVESLNRSRVRRGRRLVKVGILQVKDSVSVRET